MWCTCAGRSSTAPLASLAVVYPSRGTGTGLPLRCLSPGCSQALSSGSGRWRSPGWPESSAECREQERAVNIDANALATSATAAAVAATVVTEETLELNTSLVSLQPVCPQGPMPDTHAKRPLCPPPCTPLSGPQHQAFFFSPLCDVVVSNKWPHHPIPPSSGLTQPEWDA